MTTCRDTVSSIGIVRGKRLLPGTADGMKHVCCFGHALALDERRIKYLPEYAYGGGGILDDEYHDREWDSRRNKPRNEDGGAGGSERTQYEHIKEVWFAGTHSDMWVIPISELIL